MNIDSPPSGSKSSVTVIPNPKVDSALHAKLKQPLLWGGMNLKGKLWTSKVSN